MHENKVAAQPLRLWLIHLLPVLVLLGSATALAHTFEAPYNVVTDVDGHFTYEAVFTASSTVQLAAITVDGSDNTTVGHYVADFFCQAVLEAGEQWSWPVAGDLADEEYNGTVHLLLEVCDDSGPFEASTTVVPNPVGDDAHTWTALKACYR